MSPPACQSAPSAAPRPSLSSRLSFRGSSKSRTVDISANMTRQYKAMQVHSRATYPALLFFPQAPVRGTLV